MNIGRHHQQPVQHDLSQGKVFAECTPEQRRSLLSLATVVTVPAGRNLTLQGTQGLECGVIIEGEASVVIDGQPWPGIRGAGRSRRRRSSTRSGLNIAVVPRTPGAYEFLTEIERWMVEPSTPTPSTTNP